MKSCGVFIFFGPTFETLEDFLTAGVSERNWLCKERKWSWWKLLLANKTPFRECLFSCLSPSRFVCFYFTAELVLYVLAVCSRKCVSLQPDRLSHTWVAIQMCTLWSVCILVLSPQRYIWVFDWGRAGGALQVVMTHINISSSLLLTIH